MLCHRLFARHLAREFDGRHHGDHVVAKIRKPQRDQANDNGAGGVDDGVADVFLAHVAARVFRHDLSRLRHLEHIVKADVEKPLQDIVHVVQIHKLTVKRRSGKRDAIFLRVDVLKAVKGRLLGLIRASANALAAVDANIRIDHRVAIANADGFGWATLEAVGTALAFFNIERNRMLVLLHARVLRLSACLPAVPAPRAACAFLRRAGVGSARLAPF